MDPINQDSYEQDLKNQGAKKRKSPSKSPRRSASPERQSPRRSARLSRQTTPIAIAIPKPASTRLSSPSKSKSSMPTSASEGTANAPSVKTTAKSAVAESTTPSGSPMMEKKTNGKGGSRVRSVERKPMDDCPRCGAKDFMAACTVCSLGSGIGL